MNNKIEPTYVTFEQAKWLKEKGFNESTLTYWSKRDGLIENEITLRNHNERGDWGTSRPEQHVVVEWLRVIHDICLWVKPYADSITYQPHWCYINNKAKENNNTFHLSGNASINGSYYKTPQQAYSAAFDYILNNNLI